MTEQQARGYNLHVTGTHGYKHFFACRDNNQMHGGLSVFVRNDIQVTLLHRQVPPELIALSFGDKELLLVACYASPHGSEYSGGDNVFDTIAELMHTLQGHKHIIVIGDMNARIGDKCRSTATLNLTDPLGLHEDSEIRSYNRNRTSRDKVVCRRGKQCIHFLNETGMDVLNGSCMGDNTGEFTYHSSGIGQSVVDLAIVTPGMYEFIDTFSVSEKMTMTDHSQLWLTFRAQMQNTQVRNGGGAPEMHMESTQMARVRFIRFNWVASCDAHTYEHRVSAANVMHKYVQDVSKMHTQGV